MGIASALTGTSGGKEMKWERHYTGIEIGWFCLGFNLPKMLDRWLNNREMERFARKIEEMDQ